MKPKVSINSVALGNLRGRRKQYLFLLIAIILAIYFAATTLLFASTIFTSLRESHYQRYGEQDAIVFHTKDAPLEELIANGTFTEYGTAEILGYVLPDGQSKIHGFSIAKYDETAINLARKNVIEGRLPENGGEIALEQSFLARLRTDAGVGDTMTLTLLIPDGEDFLESPVQKSYVLVGILSDKSIHLANRWLPAIPAYLDYPAGVLSAEEQITVGGKAVVNVYARYGQDAGFSFEQLKAFCEERDIVHHGWPAISSTRFDFRNDGYNSSNGTIINYSVFFMVISLVLVLAACLGIINAFTANLEYRKRQIGLLRAVGATKKQIRDIFGREALLLAFFSVPLGLLFAGLTVWGITEAMGPNFVFRPNAFIIMAVAIAGVLCVMFAASIPLRKAGKIPPMQAIRDVDLSRKLKREKIKSKPFFNVPRLIARRNLILYKNKQISITAILIVSIVLMSMVVFAATPLLTQALQSFQVDYSLYMQSWSSDWLMEFSLNTPGITEQDRADAAALPTVNKVTGVKRVRGKILSETISPYISESEDYRFRYLTPEPTRRMRDNPRERQWLESQYNSYLESKEKYGYEQDYLSVDFWGADADMIEKLSPFVSAGSINVEKLSVGEEVLIFAPQEYGIYEVQHGEDFWFQTNYVLQNDREYDYIYQNDMFFAGDTLHISLLYFNGVIESTEGPMMYNEDGSRILPDDVVREDRTVTIGAVLEPYADGMHLQNYLRSVPVEIGNILTTNAGLRALGFDVPYHSLDITLSESPDNIMDEYLYTSLSQIAARTSGAAAHSHVAMARENREAAYGLLIAAGAIVLLFFAICVSMVSNALSARIRASKREIGTIRAVGASEGEILSSYLWQLVSMFAWGTGIGMALQLALNRWLLTKDSHFASMATLPVWQPLLFVSVLFGICYLNVRFKLAAIIRGSIVENIREL